MSRRAVGLAVIGLWLVVLGWHAGEEHFLDEAERLARGVAILAPGDTYYSVLAEGRPVGWARSSVDTLPGNEGFELETRLEMPSLSVRTESGLDSLLSLRTFRVRASGPMGDLTLDGRVTGDTLLEMISTAEGRTDTLRLPLAGPVVPPSALPLRLAASRRLTVGRSVEVDVLDPLRMEPTTVRLQVEGREVRIFADSAVRRSAEAPWVAARHDTMATWRIRQSVGPLSLVSWVGSDGRLVEARVGETIRVQRTAFELAFYPDESGGLR